MVATVTPRQQAPGAVLDRAPGPTGHRLRRLHLGSVARMSLAFHLAVSGVLVVLAVLAYAVADAAGLVGRTQRLVASLFGFSSFRFRPLELLVGAVAAACVVSALGTVAAVLAAGAYNLAARLTGGLAVTVDEVDEIPGSVMRSRV